MVLGQNPPYRFFVNGKSQDIPDQPCAAVGTLCLAGNDVLFFLFIDLVVIAVSAIVESVRAFFLESMKISIYCSRIDGKIVCCLLFGRLAL